MTSNAELLVKFGFIKKSEAKKVEESAKRAKKSVTDYINSLDPDKKLKFADEEEMEKVRMANPYKTGFPTPIDAFRLHFESYSMSVEALYFWLLHHLRQDVGFYETYKITDVFSATEQSAFFGNAQNRLGIQQDRASQYLKFIAEMLKTLFPLVREARILQEKLSYYSDVYASYDEKKAEDKSKADKAKTSDMVLKDQWTTLVEGGTKNPASVYGMAQNVGFTILPDLFFNTFIKAGADEGIITKIVDGSKPGEGIKFGNERVKSALKRKLAQYTKWRDHTRRELETRQKFIIRYIRQHYMSMRMYINWVKPYLKNVKRMSMKDGANDTPELVSVFDSQFLELEVLAHKHPFGEFYPVIIAHFEYRTVPQLSYQAEGYQRGPIHVGKIEVTLRSYIWTKDQIENYKKYREYEDLDLLKEVDASLKDALDALGDDLKKFVEAGEELFKKEDKKEEKKKEDTYGGALDPFKALYSGFKELGGAFVPKFSFGESKKKDSADLEREGNMGSAMGTVKFSLGFAYKNFKKAHKMLAW